MRRLLHFRLSTLLLLVALWAVVLAWWKDHRDLQQRLRDTEAKLRDAELLGQTVREGREELLNLNMEAARFPLGRQNLAEGKALPAVLELLNDPRAHVRIDAVNELVNLVPPEEAVSALLPMFAKDADEAVHRRIAEWIYLLEWKRAERAGAQRAE